MCKNKASCVHVACNIGTPTPHMKVWSDNRGVVIGCGSIVMGVWPHQSSFTTKNYDKEKRNENN